MSGNQRMERRYTEAEVLAMIGHLRTLLREQHEAVMREWKRERRECEAESVRLAQAAQATHEEFVRDLKRRLQAAVQTAAVQPRQTAPVLDAERAELRALLERSAAGGNQESAHLLRIADGLDALSVGFDRIVALVEELSRLFPPPKEAALIARPGAGDAVPT